MHHFEVELEHAEGRVVAVEGRAVRAPWSICPGALAELQRLVGAPVGEPWRVDRPDDFCTHQLDLASLTVRFAGSGVDHRRLDVTVSEWSGPTTTAELAVDGELGLRWEVEGGNIVSPEPYAGRSLGSGFGSWANAALSPGELELAIVLRRATSMRHARGFDMDVYERLDESGLPPGSCFASQPARIQLARRNRGSSVASI